MFEKWKERRKVQKCWEGAIICLTGSGRATDPVDSDMASILVLGLNKTLLLYSNDNRMTKNTLRILYHLKRMLADKRAFDLLKALEYVIAADGIAKKKINQIVKERIMAHYLQIAQSYGDIASRRQKSNPFVPGEVLNDEQPDN